MSEVSKYYKMDSADISSVRLEQFPENAKSLATDENGNIIKGSASQGVIESTPLSNCSIFKGLNTPIQQDARNVIGVCMFTKDDMEVTGISTVIPHSSTATYIEFAIYNCGNPLVDSNAEGSVDMNTSIEFISSGLIGIPPFDSQLPDMKNTRVYGVLTQPITLTGWFCVLLSASSEDSLTSDLFPQIYASKNTSMMLMHEDIESSDIIPLQFIRNDFIPYEQAQSLTWPTNKTLLDCSSPNILDYTITPYIKMEIA